MPHQGNSPADIIGYDGQGKPIYKGHGGNGNGNGNGVINTNGNGVIRNSNGRVNGTGARGVRRQVGNTGRGVINGTQNINGVPRTTTNSNPVTRTFFAPQSPRYYRPNGQIVPVGAPLHQHQDGTIMTEHSMGPNDNSVVVTTLPNNRSATRTISRNTNNGTRRVTQTRRATTNRTMGGTRNMGRSY